MLPLLVHTLCTLRCNPSPATELLLHLSRNPIGVSTAKEVLQSVPFMCQAEYIQPDLKTSVLFWSEFAGAGGESCQNEGSLTAWTVLLSLHATISSLTQKPKLQITATESVEEKYK